jgi:hypothetical protein
VSLAESIDIFNIKKSIISKSNNSINKLYITHKEIRETLNTEPLSIDFMLKSFFKKSKMNMNEFKFLSMIIKRIVNTTIAKINTPKAVTAGVLNNYIKSSKDTKIKKKDIIRYLGVSNSSIQEYTPRTGYLFEYLE